MADDWEDWENDDFTPQLPAAPATNPVAASDDIEESKFAGEDEEEEQPKFNVPKPQQVCTGLQYLNAPALGTHSFTRQATGTLQTFLLYKAKPSKKKTYEDKDIASRVDDEPLDDPVAEKLRRQRYVSNMCSTLFVPLCNCTQASFMHYTLVLTSNCGL